MSIFRKYKTFDELSPAFLIEKEMAVQRKSFLPYMLHTHIFSDWLKEHHLSELPIRKITPENIAEFFRYIGIEKKLDRPTCEKYKLDLKQIFVFAEKRGELEKVPFDLVALPRKKKDQGAEVIRPEDLKVLLPEIEKKDPQLYLACMIQYYCFIRPGRELRFLKIGDIDLYNGLITVRQENAKNKTKQTVTMTKQLIDLCREYEIDKADKKLFVFGNRKRFGTKPVSVNMLRWRFNKHRDALNLPKGYKFYSLKHTGASTLHRSGISMRELMDQLRHTKLDATQHYLKKHCGIVNDRIRDNFPSPI